MVGQQADAGQPQVGKNLCPDSRLMLGLLVLVVMAVSETGLMQVNENTLAFFGNTVERGLGHFAAVAADRSEDVSIRAAGVHADEHILFAGDVAANQSQMALIIERADVLNGFE